jgi:ribosomal protein S27E
MKRETANSVWRQFMRRCPHCEQVWLIFSTREGEAQICKSCGSTFSTSRRDGGEGVGAATSEVLRAAEGAVFATAARDSTAFNEARAEA